MPRAGKRKGLALFLAGLACGAVLIGFLFLALDPWDREPAVHVIPQTPEGSDPADAGDALPVPPAVPTTAPPAAGPDRDSRAPVGFPPLMSDVPPAEIPSAVPSTGAVPVPAATPAAEAPSPDASSSVVARDLSIPVSGIAFAQLADTYADARGEGSLHDAIDIMAPTGTPVLAVDDGTLVKLFDSKRGGLTIYQFDEASEHAYYYAHLDKYADGVIEGKTVKRGDLIGYVGYTGNANPQGPHLHFAVFVLGPEKNWWQGSPLNPYGLFRRQ